jgi:hypothetical protein
VAKAQALRDFYAALEAYTPLVQALGHVVGATTLERGARIIGDSVRLRPHPIPSVVIGLGIKNQGRSQAERMWDVAALIYGPDIFLVADILEILEVFSLDSRWTDSSIRKIEWLSSQQIELEPGQQYISCLATVRLYLVT